MADARMQPAVFLALLGGKIALGKSSPAVYFIPAPSKGLGGEGRDSHLLHGREQREKNSV